MLDVEWTKDMNRKFAKKLGHGIENGNSTSNIPLLPYLSTLRGALNERLGPTFPILVAVVLAGEPDC